MCAAENLRIALLGSGIIARSGHVPAILNIPGLDLIAVFSRTTSSATKLVKDFNLHDTEIYANDRPGFSFESLLARDDIHLYIVALPIINQPRYIKDLLKAGKHVLSEKPIAADCEASKDLLDFYSKLPSTKGIWGVAENFRFKQPLEEAIPLVSALGGIATFHIYDENYTDTDNAWYKTDWRTNPQHQGGFILDGGLHLAAVLRAIVESQGSHMRISRVAAFGTQIQPHLPPIDTLTATISLANGINGSYSGCYAAGVRRKDSVIICREGSIELTPRSLVAYDISGKKIVDKVWDNDKPEHHVITRELRAFVDSVRSNSLDKRLDPVEAYMDVHLIEQMLKSAAQNGEPHDITYL